MKKRGLFFLFLMFSLLSNAQSKTWIKLFTNGVESISEVTQSRAVKKGMLEAFEGSSMTAKKALRNMDISPIHIQKIFKRFPKEDLAKLTKKMDGMSPNAMKSLYGDLARRTNEESKAFLKSLDEKPKLLKSYERVYNTGLGVKFRTDPIILQDVASHVSPVVLKMNNYNKAGKIIDGIPFRKRIISVGGIKYEGVFPDFSKVSVCNMRLPNNLINSSSEDQMIFATKTLKQNILKDPSIKANFSAVQLTAINKGRNKIPGYSWHYKESPSGKMQLIPDSYRYKVSYTSEKSIWGSKGFVNSDKIKSKLSTLHPSKGLSTTLEGFDDEELEFVSEVYNNYPSSIKKKFLADINSRPKLLNDLIKQPKYISAYKKACLNNIPQEYRSQKYIVQQIMDNKKVIKIVTADHKLSGKTLNGIKYLKKQSHKGDLLVEGVYPNLDNVYKFKSSTKGFSKISDTKGRKEEALKQLKKAVANPNSATSSKFTNLQRENIISSKVDDGYVKDMGWFKGADGELVLLTNRRLGSILNGSINSINDVIVSKGLTSNIKRSGIVELFNKSGEKLGEYNPITKTIVPTFASRSSKASGLNDLLTGSNFIPNAKYKVNGTTYLTDEQGRVISMMRPHFAKVQKVARNGGEQVGSVTQRGLTSSTHDGGHIVGNQLGGISEGLNYVPQRIELNRGAIKDFEDNIAKNINKAKNYEVKHVYKGTSRTPSSIEYSVTIGGERIKKTITNNL